MPPHDFRSSYATVFPFTGLAKGLRNYYSYKSKKQCLRQPSISERSTITFSTPKKAFCFVFSLCPPLGAGDMSHEPNCTGKTKKKQVFLGWREHTLVLPLLATGLRPVRSPKFTGFQAKFSGLICVHFCFAEI